MKYLLILLALCGTAHADQLCFQWTPPTRDVEGKPQDPTKITAYRLFYNKYRGELPNKFTDAPGNVTRYCVTGLEVGDYYAMMRTIAGSEQSADSNVLAGYTSPDGSTAPPIIIEPPPVVPPPVTPAPASTRELCISESGKQLGCFSAAATTTAPPAPESTVPNLVSRELGTWSLRQGTTTAATSFQTELDCMIAGGLRAIQGVDTKFRCDPVGRSFTVRKP